MNKEELLKPRWKVIADFPGSRYTIGQIIETNYWFDRSEEKGYEKHKMNKSWVVKTEWNISSTQFFDSYPAIFKKLEWWEERDYKLMESIKYLRSTKTNKIYEIYEWSATVGYMSGYRNVAYSKDYEYYPHSGIKLYADWYEPATEEEYLNQKHE